MSVEARLREKEDERRKKSGEVAADFVSKMFSTSSNKSMLGMSVQAEDEKVLAAASTALSDECSAATDRKALMLLFEATEGVRWRKSTHWGTDEDLSEWYGISCDDQGRVTDIDLGENNLSGRLPVCIGKLDKLLSLYLDYNYIRGALPPTLCHCTGLRDLCLNNNLLIDAIPSTISLLRDLENGLGDLLDGIHPRCSSITLQQLLQHRSGLPFELEQDGRLPEAVLKARLETVRLGLVEPPEFEPGTRYSYSNFA